MQSKAKPAPLSKGCSPPLLLSQNTAFGDQYGHGGLAENIVSAVCLDPSYKTHAFDDFACNKAEGTSAEKCR